MKLELHNTVLINNIVFYSSPPTVKSYSHHTNTFMITKWKILGWKVFSYLYAYIKRKKEGKNMFDIEPPDMSYFRTNINEIMMQYSEQWHMQRDMYISHGFEHAYHGT